MNQLFSRTTNKDKTDTESINQSREKMLKKSRAEYTLYINIFDTQKLKRWQPSSSSFSPHPVEKNG